MGPTEAKIWAEGGRGMPNVRRLRDTYQGALSSSGIDIGYSKYKHSVKYPEYIVLNSHTLSFYVNKVKREGVLILIGKDLQFILLPGGMERIWS